MTNNANKAQGARGEGNEKKTEPNILGTPRRETKTEGEGFRGLG